MSVSKQTIDMVFEQLKVFPNGIGYAELEKLTGYSRASLKQAISALNLKGSISTSRGKPSVFKALDAPQFPGQRTVVYEPAPPLEVSLQEIAQINHELKTNKWNQHDDIRAQLYQEYRSNMADRKKNLLIFLVNFCEVLREDLNANELALDDVADLSKLLD